MLNLDNVTEDVYNEKLVARLRNTCAAAAAANDGAKQTKKQLNMLLDARKTQIKLVGGTAVYKQSETSNEVPEIEAENMVTKEFVQSMFEDYDPIINSQSDNDNETE